MPARSTSTALAPPDRVASERDQLGPGQPDLALAVLAEAPVGELTDEPPVKDGLRTPGVRPRNVRRGWTAARTIVLVCSDLLAATGGAGTARIVRLGSGPLPHLVDSADLSLTYADLSLALVAAWIASLAFSRAYRTRTTTDLWTQVGSILRGAVGMLAVLGVASLFARLQLSRAYVLVALVGTVVLTILGRAAVVGLFSLLLRLGIQTDRVLLVGPNAAIADLRGHLHRTSRRRVRIVDELVTDETAMPATTIGAALLPLVDRRGVTSVIVCGSQPLPHGGLRVLATQLAGTGVAVVVAPGTTEALAPTVQVQPMGDLMMLRVRDSEPGTAERATKAVIDRVGALLALIALAPVVIVCTLMILLEDGRPLLFRQVRVGKGGRPFRILKLRTMCVDAEAALHRDGLYEEYVANGYKLPPERDPRITRTGRMLRRTSLDELPQLWNVLKGEMSLVGPRPVLEAELPRYGDLLPAYTGCRPGLTGYWQVSGRSDVGFPERAELDAWYHDNRSLRFDLRILARTVLAVILREGAH